MWFIACAFVGLQLAVANQYGIFRDELYYLACGERLAWGYVDHPPFVALVAWGSRRLFGESLLAIRLLSAFAGGATLVLAGKLALLFGGDRWASALAAISVAIAPVMLFQFHVLSMNAWDILWWTATVYVIARIVVEERPRLWLIVGVLIGIGLQTKLSMVFLVFGLSAGLLLTRERRWFRSPSVLAGAVIAAAIAAPYVVWQIANSWPTLEFIRNANELKNVHLTPLQFAGSQLLEMHPLNAVLLLTGIWFLFTAQQGRFRLLAWAYVAVAGLIFVQNGKTYYLSPAYPWLLAAGSAGTMRLLAARPRIVKSVVLALVLLAGAVVAPAALPLLPIERYVSYTTTLGLRPPDAERNETAELPQFFADMFGWDAIVSTVAEVYQSLPPHERVSAAILAPNYGVAGAIDFLGPRHGLPIKAISPHNSYFLWGPGDASGAVLIVLGGTAEGHERAYGHVERVATIECGYCMPFENRRPVFVLRQPRLPLSELWPMLKNFI